MIIPETIANKIYDILTAECGAPDWMRDDFVYFCTNLFQSREYRFIGSLGFGGKFWHNDGRFYVNCYPEDMTVPRAEAIKSANEKLAAVYSAIMPAVEPETGGTSHGKSQTGKVS